MRLPFGVLLVSKKKRTLLHKLDEVSQLLHEAGQLLMKSVSKYLLAPIKGCGRLGTRVARPSLGKYRNPIPTTSFNIIV